MLMNEFQLPNPVAEYTLTNINHYDQLNASSLQESDEAFVKALKKVLDKSELDSTVQRRQGKRLLVDCLENGNGVVLKRLWMPRNPADGDLARAESLFEKFQAEHQIVQQYFGFEHTPVTEFVRVEKTFDGGNGVGEFVMVQEEIVGNGKNYYFSCEGPLTISDKLKESFRSYIRRYRRMMRESGKITEGEFMVDTVNERVVVIDSNDLIRCKDYVEGNKLLSKLGSGDSTGLSQQDLLDLLIAKIEPLQVLQSMLDDEIKRLFLSRDFDLFNRAREWVIVNFGEDEASAFDRLYYALSQFPPFGDNLHIQTLIEKFGIEIDEV